MNYVDAKQQFMSVNNACKFVLEFECLTADWVTMLCILEVRQEETLQSLNLLLARAVETSQCKCHILTCKSEK